MKTPDIDYVSLAGDLLERATMYDHEHWNDEIDDGGFARCETLRAWLELRLKTKLTDESAMSINRHTAHPGEIESEDLAEQLPHLLAMAEELNHQHIGVPMTEIKPKSKLKKTHGVSLARRRGP